MELKTIAACMLLLLAGPSPTIGRATGPAPAPQLQTRAPSQSAVLSLYRADKPPKGLDKPAHRAAWDSFLRQDPKAKGFQPGTVPLLYRAEEDVVSDFKSLLEDDAGWQKKVGLGAGSAGGTTDWTDVYPAAGAVYPALEATGTPDWLYDGLVSLGFAARCRVRGGDVVLLMQSARLPTFVRGSHWGAYEAWALTAPGTKVRNVWRVDGDDLERGPYVAWKQGQPPLGQEPDFSLPLRPQ